MGLEVSSRYLQQADTPAKAETGPNKADASAKERFEKVMERGSEEQHPKQDESLNREKKAAPDSMPSPSALMESLFNGRMGAVLTASGQMETASVSGSSDIDGLVDKLVERILVSEPGKGTPEVRITLADGSLAGTELSLSRTQDGQLCVRLSCADAAAFQTAVGAQDSLRSALERQGETVRLEISQTDTHGGNEGDSRRRSQGLIHGAPESA